MLALCGGVGSKYSRPPHDQQEARRRGPPTAFALELARANSLPFNWLQAIATKVDPDRGAGLGLANDSGLGAIGIHAIVIAAVLACQQGTAHTDLAISRSERPL